MGHSSLRSILSYYNTGPGVRTMTGTVVWKIHEGNGQRSSGRTAAAFDTLNSESLGPPDGKLSAKGVQTRAKAFQDSIHIQIKCLFPSFALLCLTSRSPVLPSIFGFEASQAQCLCVDSASYPCYSAMMLCGTIFFGQDCVVYSVVKSE